MMNIHEEENRRARKDRGNPDDVFRNLLASIKPPSSDPEVESSLSAVATKNEALLQQIDLLIEMQDETKWPSTFSPGAKNIGNQQQSLNEHLDSGMSSLSSESSNASYISYETPGIMSLTDSLSSKLTVQPDGVDKINSADVDNIANSMEGHFDEMGLSCSPMSSPSMTSSDILRNKLSTSKQAERCDRSSSESSITASLLLSPTNLNVGSAIDTSYSEHELSAIRKFLLLTTKYLDNFSRPSHGLEDLSADKTQNLMMVELKNVIVAQQTELAEHRALMEHFNVQLQQLLTKVKALKEQQFKHHAQYSKELQLLSQQLQEQKRDLEQTSLCVLDNVECAANQIALNGTRSSAIKPCAVSTHIPSTDLHSRSSGSIRPHPENHGYMIWTIPDVMKKIEMMKSSVDFDDSYLTRSFRLGEYGYQINVTLYLNGHGRTQGRSIAVYANLTCGEYDPILPWPVLPEFRFTLLDQETDTVKCVDHTRLFVIGIFEGEGFGPQHEQQVERVPVPRRYGDTDVCLFGTDDFIEHNDLVKHRYVVDDVFFLRVDAYIEDAADYQHKRIY